MEPIKGIGFKTAHKLLKQHSSIQEVYKAIANTKKYSIPKGYFENFKLAYMTFLYQIVYDFEKEICLPLNEPDSDNYYGKLFIEMEDKTFCGELIDSASAKDICEGHSDIENQCVELNCLNEPINSVENLEGEESAALSMKDISDFENKPILKRKPVSVQKKICFSMKGSKSKCKRVPSPYKNKIAGNLKNLPFIKNMSEKGKSKSCRKRTFNELQEMARKRYDDSEDSQMEEDGSHSLMGMFKRAKKQEGDQ